MVKNRSLYNPFMVAGQAAVVQQQASQLPEGLPRLTACELLHFASLTQVLIPYCCFSSLPCPWLNRFGTSVPVIRVLSVFPPKILKEYWKLVPSS